MNSDTVADDVIALPVRIRRLRKLTCHQIGSLQTAHLPHGELPLPEINLKLKSFESLPLAIWKKIETFHSPIFYSGHGC